MVSIQAPITEFVERPYHKPEYLAVEEKDNSQLKSRILSAKGYALSVGKNNPRLWLTENIGEFIQEIKRAGCNLPDRSIDRGIRSAKQSLRNKGEDVDDDNASRMEADHRQVFGGMI